MSKFYPIGTIVNYDGVSLVVKGQCGNRPACAGCFFTDNNRRRFGLKRISCHLHGMQCTASQRKDNRHVVFLPIKQRGE